MRRGYHVFRALSPACSCDLIALAGDRALRIEVRTGRLRRGELHFSRNREWTKRTEADLDHYAVVVYDEQGGASQVVYDPALPAGLAPE
jgi:hypothetical protein